MIKLLIIALTLFSAVILPQESSLQKSSIQNEQSFQSSMQEIESGIDAGEVKLLAKYLGSKTYFSFLDGTTGYYSSNQAFYVLQNFFNIYSAISFQVENIGDNGSYATGIYNYIFKGKKDSANVYISFKQIGGEWKITQITFN